MPVWRGRSCLQAEQAAKTAAHGWDPAGHGWDPAGHSWVAVPTEEKPLGAQGLVRFASRNVVLGFLQTVVSAARTCK